MGSVGSFHRIQDFLNKDIRLDSRRLPSPMKLLPHQDQLSSPKKPSFSGSTDTATEKFDMAATPPNEHTLSPFDAILVQNADFGWDKGKSPLLCSINMTVPRNKFTMVVGPVGCGKSTLLKALLGEVPTLSGSIQISSLDIAFCDQSPWHMNGTVRQSITGALEFEGLWYQTVVHACALAEDHKQLSQGDQTLIGSKGISLSGGQSQRIVSFGNPLMWILLTNDTPSRHLLGLFTLERKLSSSMMYSAA
jgi:ABC-type multidrug transport system fused ATPase/permease subunit